jgi:nucleotide-binding universal stress UspA family protein
VDAWSVVLAIACWVAFGAVATVVMRRRGHDTFTWALLFLFLGPLGFAVASGRAARPPLPVSASPRPGLLDVLVADDGSPNAEEALDAALAVLNGHATSFTVANVIDLDAAGTMRGVETEAEARRQLAAARARLQSRTEAEVDVVLLRGPAAKALEDFAESHGYELIVAGSRGRGASRALVGSVAEHLVAHSRVPVLIGKGVPTPG